RSASANAGNRAERFSSTGGNTPVTFVKPKQSQPLKPHSQSFDSGLVSMPSSTQAIPSCSTVDTPFSQPRMLQVHEFIFLGDADSIANTQYLCENNIRCFVNVSENATGVMRSSQSCNCLHRSDHDSKSIAQIPYSNDMPLKELFEKFRSVNDIIKQARNKAQRVLIFSENGLAACQVFALAYNVQYYNLDLDRALDNFERLKVKVELSDHLRNMLSEWAALCDATRVGVSGSVQRFC
ncbi:unnamed protein product, partial [Nippostrongylus brasiliensis]|uniref:DSPc domain-containing protein n=1 Tax=Nippostrongylus brasiliensis TaxID=27835 RepID=A0A0N4XH74_NIPBR